MLFNYQGPVEECLQLSNFEHFEINQHLHHIRFTVEYIETDEYRIFQSEKFEASERYPSGITLSIVGENDTGIALVAFLHIYSGPLFDASVKYREDGTWGVLLYRISGLMGKAVKHDPEWID